MRTRLSTKQTNKPHPALKALTATSSDSKNVDDENQTPVDEVVVVKVTTPEKNQKKDFSTDDEVELVKVVTPTQPNANVIENADIMVLERKMVDVSTNLFEYDHILSNYHSLYIYFL